MLSDDLKRRKSRCPALFAVVAVAAVAFGLYFLFAGRVPGRVILEADFEKGMIEYLPADPYSLLLLSDRLIVRDVVETLERASLDDRVKGMVARVGNARITPALVQELRAAVIAFRKTGKPAIAYAESFGEAGPGNLSYYLASAFDEVYLQPSGAVGLTGLISERSFYRGALDKLGILPRLDGRKEYKSYRYVFTERKYLPPHREAVLHVTEVRFGQMVKGIAGSRGLSEEGVRALIDNGPFIGQDAVDAKLVDALAYRDEVYEKIKKKTEDKAEFLKLAEYGRRAGGLHEKGKTVALIYGVGGIQRGKSGYNPATGELVMGSDTVASAFRQAVEDKDVKAILFRIDSPGGSVVASDAIWRETVNAKKAGKPVIVSMGSTAASGGYYVAMAADKIVAQPGTITGSIGVIGGKIVTAGFWNKLGVTWDEVHIGKNADAWTFRKDFTPEQRSRFGKWLDRIYEDFTAKVGQGRNMPQDEVEKIAKGRIWTGEDAKRLGLVDELGGFPAALKLARKAAGIPDDAGVRLKVYPEKKSLFRRIVDLDFISAEEETESGLARYLEDLQPLAKAAQSLGSSSSSDVLKMQEFE